MRYKSQNNHHFKEYNSEILVYSQNLVPINITYFNNIFITLKRTLYLSAVTPYSCQHAHSLETSNLCSVSTNTPSLDISQMCMLSHFSSVWPCGIPPGSCVHGILQVTIMEWIAMPSPRRSSQPRDGTFISYVSCIGRQVLYHQCHLGSPFIEME